MIDLESNHSKPMDIKFRQGSEELSDKLMERAQIKLSKLTRFITEQTDESFVYVDVERESGSKNSESMWSASINLDHAGTHFNAMGKGSTPDKATELAIKDLKREIHKAKGKQQSITKRGRELLKSLRRGFS